MSQQGLARTQQLLQVIGAQLPSIAQASETPGIDIAQFIHGAVMRSGVQYFDGLGRFIHSLAECIGPATPQATPDGPPPLDDRIADT